MKYVKTYENFQVNEEISFRGLAPIITSLFLTFNSFDASAVVTGGARGGRMYAKYATKEITSISDKIERDLERIKSETQDPELLKLIESVQSLDGWKYDDGFEKVDVVVNDLKSYIQSQNINESLVSDTLNNLSSGNIELIKSDYQMLLQKYQEIDEHTENMKLILIIVCTLFVSFGVMIGYKYFKDGLPG